MQTNSKHHERWRRPIARCGSLCFHQRIMKHSLPKMELLYSTELCDIYKDLDKDGVHLPPPCQQRRPQTKTSTQCCRRMPQINMVVDLIESFDTIKEEADERMLSHQQNIRWHSRIRSSHLLTFDHKIGEAEEEAQDHYATIRKIICPNNPDHVAQSMSLQLRDESHSPLPVIQFLAIPYLSNTSTPSNTYEQLHLRMVWPKIFDPSGSLCNALAVDSMTQSKLWKGSLPVLHIYPSQ